VEVQSYEEAREAIKAGADIIMLDNLEGQALIDCARKLKEEFGKQNAGGRDFLIESSGGIDVGNVKGGGHFDEGESLK